MPSAPAVPSIEPGAAAGPAPPGRRRWADRAAGALAGAGLFAAGVVSADHLGSPGVGTPIGGNVAVAEGLSVDQANLLRQELDDSPERPLLAGGEAIARVSRLASPSVVHIECRYRDGDGDGVEETGSGVLIRHPRWADVRNGRLFVLTNRHVVAGAGGRGDVSGIDLRLADGHTVRPTKVWMDQATDLAVLEIRNRDLPAIHFGNSDALEIGHFVLALGSPFGLDRSVTLGIVSAKGRRQLDLGTEDLINQDFLQTDAAINPGNSGGPLIDLRGRLVGINTAIASSSGGSEGIGFSIPANLVRRVFDELLTHGRVRRAYLGVQLDNRFDRASLSNVGLDRLYGARVQVVKAGTPAAEAGLRRNDVVLKFGTIEVQDLDHLINLVSLTPVGERVELTVLRDRRRLPMTLVLSERPERTARR